MKIIEKKINNNLNISSYLNNIDNNNILFFDIETTGFSYINNYLYLIGYIYYSESNWKVVQLFAEDINEELHVLKYFLNICTNFKYILSFNGDRFDIPYLQKKSTLYDIDSNILNNIQSIDIYKIIKKYKNLFNLENYKLKSIEKFLGISRKDIYTGGELIEQYLKYTVTKNPKLKENLLLHNYDDLIGMLKLLPILDYTNSFNNLLSLNENNILNYEIKNEYLNMYIKPKNNIKFNHTITKNNWNITFTKNENIHLQIKIINETLYHYFKNYKDYYYIKSKDEAIHKSIATFLPKTKKIKATSKTAYIKKTSTFIQIYDIAYNIPVFRDKNLKKNLYITLNDLINNKEIIKTNIKAILAI